MPKLRRTHDGKGHTGSIVESITWNEDGTYKEISGDIPTIGESVIIRSLTPSTYAEQDFWVTSPVTEILEEKKNDKGLLEYMKFKTGNSTYELMS